LTAPRLLPYHLAGADSLREIVNGLSCCNGKLVHPGIKEPPRRSTLSYANNHRKAELFEELFWRLSDHFRSTNFMGSPGVIIEVA